MWPTLVINLADNTARLANSAAQLEAQSIAFEPIAAVNGWQMTDAEISQVYDANANATCAKAPLVRPEIGCYLSHIKAWQAIADGTADGGFIFEDDFQADNSLGEVLEQLSVEQQGWDMVKLFSFDQSPKVLTDAALGNGHRLVTPYRVPTCLIGYGLTKSAAQRLISRVPKFFRPVDEDQKFFWETGLTVALVLPSPILVGDQQTVTGTIGAERRRLKPKATRVLWRSAVYRLGYALRLHYHRAKGLK